MNRAATIALSPISVLYGAIVKARLAGYASGFLKTHSVPAPVISVGNLTTGGTGKTPLVLWLARHLAERGHRVCVLTRGYGRPNSQERVVVSDGSQVFSDVEQAGDEALMMAEALQGRAAVVCDPDRVSAANWAVENLRPDVFILDDGFQNLRINRDVNLVTVDATNPWGNRRLLPAGSLREPITSLQRADCIILTRTEASGDADFNIDISQVTDAPVLTSKTVIETIRPLNSCERKTFDESVLNQPVAAFCGIGNPTAFFQQLRNEGFDLRHTEAFRDHHKYSQSDIDRVTQGAVASGAQALITTSKDAVKLGSMRFALPCYIAEIEMEISEADRLLALIDRAIQTKRSEVSHHG